MSKIEMQLVDGKIEGRLVERDDEGRPVMEAQFRNGLLEGPLRLLGADGRIARELSFRAGQLHGDTIIHEPNRPARIMRFEQGEHVAETREATDFAPTGWLRRLLARARP